MEFLLCEADGFKPPKDGGSNRGLQEAAFPEGTQVSASEQGGYCKEFLPSLRNAVLEGGGGLQADAEVRAEHREPFWTVGNLMALEGQVRRSPLTGGVPLGLARIEGESPTRQNGAEGGNHAFSSDRMMAQEVHIISEVEAVETSVSVK
eukprot:5666323-Amphidinium_carterae.1